MILKMMMINCYSDLEDDDDELILKMMTCCKDTAHHCHACLRRSNRSEQKSYKSKKLSIPTMGASVGEVFFFWKTCLLDNSSRDCNGELLCSHLCNPWASTSYLSFWRKGKQGQVAIKVFGLSMWRKRVALMPYSSLKTFWKHFENILKTFWKHFENILKTF